ncbi:MAG: cupin domain-containing protein [Bacilli bacterium]
MLQKPIEVKNLRGGLGSVFIEKNDLLPIHCKLYAKITIPSGCSIGPHAHLDDEEMIYCLSGVGKVLIDEQFFPFEAGMTNYTPKGHKHSLINDNNQPLVILAAIFE